MTATTEVADDDLTEGTVTQIQVQYTFELVSKDDHLHIIRAYVDKMTTTKLK